MTISYGLFLNALTIFTFEKEPILGSWGPNILIYVVSTNGCDNFYTANGHFYRSNYSSSVSINRRNILIFRHALPMALSRSNDERFQKVALMNN